MKRKRCDLETPRNCMYHHEGCNYGGPCEFRSKLDYNRETIVDALKWVEAIITHYSKTRTAEDALNGVLGEIQTCIAIGEFPDNDGTRFRDATKRLSDL